ncbi:MAG: hypothetical protein M0Z33_06080, partial [Actinomycetota bacterium]|nr:hypothetical protein [Actinomycetota bacterium]
MQGRRQVSFVLHELGEYLVAIALVVVGFHVSGSAEALLVAVGIAMLLLGALTSGRLGAYHLLSRRAHHVGDLVLAAAVALSPLLAYRSLHVVGTVLAEALALVLLRIERATAYSPAAATRVASPSGAPAIREGAPPAPSSGEDAAARVGAAAGATAASAITAAAQLAP